MTRPLTLRLKFILCAAGLALQAGCTTVGPDYVPPVSAIADTWQQPANANPIDPAWWQGFDDPQLTALITRALAGSPDVAIAEARLREARANRAAVMGTNLPQVNAGGAATENRISENGQLPLGQIPGFSPGFSLFDLGFDASWEADFWGRRQRQGESAEANVGMAEADRDAALVMLSAEIARNYMDLRLAQANAWSARQNADTLAQLARLTQLRWRAGEATKLDYERTAAELNAASTAIPQLQAQAAAAAYRIAALLGEAPEDAVPALLEPAEMNAGPHDILVGLRSDLLRRRPDVRRAERALAAATANVGVATADLFPRFSLMGGLGTQSRSADGLFDPSSTRFSIGPSFSWPIFSGGRIRAQIAAADARSDAAAARYDQAAMQALAESESAINRWLRSGESLASAREASRRQQAAFALAQLRFDRGEDNRLDLERARRLLIESERQANGAAADKAQAAVSLFRALGGGWEAAPGGS